MPTPPKTDPAPYLICDLFSYAQTMYQRALFLTLFCLWVLTGCIASSTTVDVDEDGSGTIEVTRVLETKFADNYVTNNGTRFDFDVADVEATCNRLADRSNYPDDASVRKITSSSACGASVSVEVSASESMAERLAEIDQSTYGPLSTLFQSPSSDEYILERRDDEWIFKMPTPSSSRFNNEYLSGKDADSVLAQSSFEYQITLPGTAIANENNADKVSEGTFQWKVDPMSEPTLLEARTTPPPASFVSRFGPFALGGIAALAITSGAIFIFRKRRQNSRGKPDSAKGKQRVKKPQEKAKEIPAKAPKDIDALAGALPPSQRPPTGASEPRWDEDTSLWLADHKIDGVMVFNSQSEVWEPLR